MEELAKKAYRLIRDVYRFMSFRYSHRRGVFRTFAQAEAAASGRRIGYDHKDLALQYGGGLSLRLDSSEYPVLFHIERIIKSRCTVLDFGGNVGTHYLRLRKYLDPAKLDWIVWDMPEIAKVGREMCKGLPDIRFISDIADIDRVEIDIFMACDSFQYAGIESPDALFQILADRGMRPAHILLDQLPLYDGERFVTLQNGGLVSYPHHVYNRDGFVKAVTNFDYDLVDQWEGYRDSCAIPFHPEKTVFAFTGLCFSDNRRREVPDVALRVQPS